jgi:hypothetical protein
VDPWSFQVVAVTAAAAAAAVVVATNTMASRGADADEKAAARRRRIDKIMSGVLLLHKLERIYNHSLYFIYD